MRCLRPSDPRAVSPAVGVALMLAIVVALGVVISGLVLGLADSGPASPESRLALQGDDCPVDLVHRQGDTLDGDRIRLQGTEHATPLQDQRFEAGDSVTVRPTADEVTVVWNSPDDGSTYVLSRLEPPGGSATACGGVLYAGDGGSLTSIDTGSGTLETLSVPGSVDALGPATTNLLDDGGTDVPYVDGTDRVRVTGPDGSTTTLATSGDIPGTIEGAKTRLATGRWDGSDPSVLFVNENHDTLYRVAEGGTPTAVAAPGDGTQAVVGIADVDGDAADELVFADGSQRLQALDPDGTVTALADGQLGSNNGIGAGALADFDGDGIHRAVGVDGSNQVKLVGTGTAAGGEATTTLTGGVARKSPATVADVDGDGTPEVVFVSNDSEKLKYVDDVGGANTVTLLTDADGDPIQRSEETGVV
ncbi:type IV pilin [Haloglomus halophilum]|uniref:type IV pilin n=1 Tax=Haloglomus halophilum TaxID=2962672 RepID=UPI0020C94F85|nr:type IV pilin [Haloglomus halophilum]